MTANNPLLQIDNLCVTFGKAERAFRAVDQVSLSVNEGEILAIVGESGSGKSVSMMAVIVQQHQSANHQPGSAARDHRQRHFDDFPRRHDQPESELHGGNANRRSAARAFGFAR